MPKQSAVPIRLTKEELGQLAELRKKAGRSRSFILRAAILHFIAAWRSDPGAIKGVIDEQVARGLHVDERERS